MVAACAENSSDDIEEVTVLNVTPEKMNQIKLRILDDNQPMERRNRAVFTLCAIKNNDSIDALAECLKSKTCSELLKHEIAYVLGQMRSEHAVPVLTETLEDEKEAIIVRHEAAEALGAIGLAQSLDVLRKYCKDPIEEIRETCEIALERIEYYEKRRAQGLPIEEDEGVHGVDPAPSSALEGTISEKIEKAKDIMMDTKLSLFDRYRGMFALRDIATDEAVHALTVGFSDPSALFRHEVAFVMGQLQSPASKDILTKVLCDPNENEMVRHEAAEALGAISTDDTVEILQKHLKEGPQMVRESCSVALDVHEYMSSDQFQYADGLTS